MVAPLRGDRVDEPLRCVHFEPDAPLARIRENMSDIGVDKKQRASLLPEIEDGLSAYTYLQNR